MGESHTLCDSGKISSDRGRNLCQYASVFPVVGPVPLFKDGNNYDISKFCGDSLMPDLQEEGINVGGVRALTHLSLKCLLEFH